MTGEAVEKLLARARRLAVPLGAAARLPAPRRQGHAPGAADRHLPGVRRPDARGARARPSSLELLHNAFLIHDDFQDASRRRRGAADAARAARRAARVNAGDALATLALEPLRDTTRPGRAARAARARRGAGDDRPDHRGPGAGAAAGGATTSSTLAPADYLELVAKKTCCYSTVAPLRLGALIGSRGTVALRAAGPVRLPSRRRVPDPRRPAERHGRRRRSTARTRSATSARASGR